MKRRQSCLFLPPCLIGLGILALLLLILFELAQILGEGGPKLLLWPRLNHGYEVAPVTRLAIAPWVLLLFVLGGNGACILLFGQTCSAEPDNRYVPWLLAAVVPLLMIHLIDYQRSVIAAVVSLASARRRGRLTCSTCWMHGCGCRWPLRSCSGR